MVLRSPISRRVGSPWYFLSWFASPMEQKWKMRLSRPIFVWPVITQCAPIVVPSPISTSPSMTVYGPMVTLLAELRSRVDDRGGVDVAHGCEGLERR